MRYSLEKDEEENTNPLKVRDMVLLFSSHFKSQPEFATHVTTVIVFKLKRIIIEIKIQGGTFFG